GGGLVLQLELAHCVLVHLVEQLVHVLLKLPDGVGVGGVEGQGDHGPDGGQIHLDHAVVVSSVGGGLGLELLPPAQHGQVVLQGVVRRPDGGQAGGLGGHHVDAGAVVHGQIGHAGAEELHDGVLHRAVFEGGTDELQGHVLGAHAGDGRAGEVDGDHPGIGDVV